MAHQPRLAVHADGGAPGGRLGGRAGAARGRGGRRVQRRDRRPADGGGAGGHGAGGRAGLEVLPARALPGRRARGPVPAAPGPGQRQGLSRRRDAEGAGPLPDRRLRRSPVLPRVLPLVRPGGGRRSAAPCRRCRARPRAVPPLSRPRRARPIRAATHPGG
ncbi:hypothetical protein SGPA1_31221 [Streptomyces misionensis JCM 4497]